MKNLIFFMATMLILLNYSVNAGPAGTTCVDVLGCDGYLYCIGGICAECTRCMMRPVNGLQCCSSCTLAGDNLCR
ncbi:unnamed protein product [Cunninghamella blakesleeana]